MITVCDERYWLHMPNIAQRIKDDSDEPDKVAPCHRVFDDVNRSTHCPHKPL